MTDGRRDASELTLPVHPVDFRAGAARRFGVLSPFDGLIVESVPNTDARVLAASFSDALRAADRLHSTEGVQERLRSWARRIDVRREQLARIISVETGKPIRFSRVEVEASLKLLHACCGRQSVRLHREWTPAQAAFSIQNWCDPILTTVSEAAAVLSSGRALVIKPSSRAPLASLALAALWKHGDDLDALFCVAPSSDAVGMLRASLTTPRVTEVRFRGSRDVGTFVTRSCQEAAMPVTVFPDQQLPLVLYALDNVDAQCDAVVNAVLLRPVPSLAERVSCVYVHDHIADTVIAALCEKLSQLRVGDPLADETDIGPVIDDVAVALLSDHVEDALFSGARLPGAHLEIAGKTIRPLILDEVKPFMRICSEDREGPILPVIRFSDPLELPDTTCLTIQSRLSKTTEGDCGAASIRQSAHCAPHLF
jgi:acyl-CoA reductase-like NAD-dependent aldehyde dehydrogenase